MVDDFFDIRLLCQFKLRLLHDLLDVVGFQVLEVVGSVRDLQGLEGIFGRLRDGHESLHQHARSGERGKGCRRIA